MKLYKIIDCKTSVQNEKVTVVKVTILDMRDSYETYEAVGKAFKHPNDSFSDKVGYRLARARAIRSALKKMRADYKWRVARAYEVLDLANDLNRQIADQEDFINILADRQEK